MNFLNGYVTTKARQFHESIAMSLPISNRSPIIETQDQNTASSDSSRSSKDTHPTSQAPQLLNKPPTTDPDTDRSSYFTENLSSTINSVDTPNEQEEEIIIIRSLKSGFSKEATLIALDEFLLSVHADEIRMKKTITNS